MAEPNKKRRKKAPSAAHGATAAKYGSDKRATPAPAGAVKIPAKSINRFLSIWNGHALKPKHVDFKQEHFETIFRGLEGLKSHYGTWKAVSAKLGVSRGLIHLWQAGEQVIREEYAQRLALAENEYGKGLADQLKKWLHACGYHRDTESFHEKADELTALLPQVTDSLDALQRTAKQKGLLERDFRLALSCYLGQMRLKDDILDWIKASNGYGTTAVFWGDLEEIKRVLAKDETKEFIRSVIEPGPEMRSDWASINRPCELRVCIFLCKGPAAYTAAQVNESFQPLLSYLAEKGLSKSDQARLEVYTSTVTYPHAVDCWLFISAQTSFATYATRASDLDANITNIANSGAKDLQSQIWDWISQTIRVDDKEKIVHEWLKPHAVEFDPERKIYLVPNPHAWAKVKITSS